MNSVYSSPIWERVSAEVLEIGRQEWARSDGTGAIFCCCQHSTRSSMMKSGERRRVTYIIAHYSAIRVGCVTILRPRNLEISSCAHRDVRIAFVGPIVVGDTIVDLVAALGANSKTRFVKLLGAILPLLVTGSGFSPFFVVEFFGDIPSVVVSIVSDLTVDIRVCIIRSRIVAFWDV